MQAKILAYINVNRQKCYNYLKIIPTSMVYAAEPSTLITESQKIDLVWYILNFAVAVNKLLTFHSFF